MKVSDLVFGNDVLKGDYLKVSPTMEGLLKIDRDDQLQEFKDIHGDLEIVINKQGMWFEKFVIPAWIEIEKNYNNNIANAIKTFGTCA